MLTSTSKYIVYGIVISAIIIASGITIIQPWNSQNNPTLATITTGSPTVNAGSTVTLTVTVTDTSRSPIPTTGVVSLSDGNAGGTFSPSPQCLISPAGSCTVSYTPTVNFVGGNIVIIPTYKGDVFHHGNLVQYNPFHITINPPICPHGANEVIKPGLYGVSLITYCNYYDFTNHTDVGIDQVNVWRDVRFSQLNDSINILPNNTSVFSTTSSKATLLNLVKDASKEVYYGELLHAISTLHKLETDSSSLIVDPTSQSKIVSQVKGIEYTTALAATTGTPVKNIP